MSTNAGIHYVKGNRLYSICVHYDGKLDYVGKILHTHYRDEKKVQRLINLGDISILGERVEPIGEHSFEKAEKGTTVAYHRDRGEPLNKDTRVIDEGETLDLLIYISDLYYYVHNYVYVEHESTWYYIDGHEGYGLLSEALGEEEVRRKQEEKKFKRFITRKESVDIARHLRNNKNKYYVVFRNSNDKPVGMVFNREIVPSSLKEVGDILFSVNWDEFQKLLNKRPTQAELADFIYRKGNYDVNLKAKELNLDF